jgi:esterase/lipase
MVTWLFIFFVIVILILIVAYNVVNQNEDKALFYPSRRMKWKPKIPYNNIYINIEDYTDFCFRKEEKNKNKSYISCWHFNNFKGAKTVCFFHGTTGSISDRKYIIDLCYNFKVNLFLFDYSGYGESCSLPHKLLLRENAEIVYKYLTKISRVSWEDLIIWSESLGCLSASYLCAKYKCGKLIILSGFSSLDDIIIYRSEGYKRIASQFFTNILSYKMDFLPVKDYLTQVKCPVVIIHSKKDELIPYDCSIINYKNVFHKNKLLVNISGGHSCPNIKTKQLRKIFSFCDIPNDLSSGTIDTMLKNLETVAKTFPTL